MNWDRFLKEMLCPYCGEGLEIGYCDTSGAVFRIACADCDQWFYDNPDMDMGDTVSYFDLASRIALDEWGDLARSFREQCQPIGVEVYYRGALIADDRFEALNFRCASRQMTDQLWAQGFTDTHDCQYKEVK